MMARALALLLPLAGCAQHAAEPTPAPALKYRACQPLPAPLPKLRTIEALKARAERVEFMALDCAERLRIAVEAYDDLSATRAR